MQIDNQIASHRWRLRRANSYHIPDGTVAIFIGLFPASTKSLWYEMFWKTKEFGPAFCRRHFRVLVLSPQPRNQSLQLI